MSRRAKPIAISLMPDEIQQLDALVEAAEVRASRSSVIRALIVKAHQSHQRATLRTIAATRQPQEKAR